MYKISIINLNIKLQKLTIQKIYKVDYQDKFPANKV